MLKYSELTPQFFKDYETHMLNSGRSLTLVGIYCRALRRAIKMAIQQKFMKEEDYPFGKRTEGKYPIPKGNRSKRRALPDEIYVNSFILHHNWRKKTTPGTSFYLAFIVMA